ncbi:specifically androgen-regulated gene protein-like [Notolabrus celidotus]|uniref:specifically androgen-regulated gene protein-like n=1 Tax=Notolabrus celidotus TaxID=1203425 RepID=UPI00148F4E3C|nr:specifically androgen-regulated gene protein-like [Notolabrus celidotus]
MPKSDTWPGGIALESLNNMDSAGSCDSVISMNSGYSEDSMEHLSPEERACLMYLEETIEALEVQEDSGISNDEPDSGFRVNDISSFRSDESSGDQKSDQAFHHAFNGPSQPQSTPGLETSENLGAHLGPSATESVSGSEIHQPSALTTELCVSKDEDGNLRIVPSTSLSPDHSPKAPSSKAPEVYMGFIPPPSDFMDEPAPHHRVLTAKDLLSPQVVSDNKPGPTVDLEQLLDNTSTKRASMSFPDKPQELSLSAVSPSPPLSPPPPPEVAEPKSPPAVAPKPKRLPANIILKSHKAAVADGNSGHSAPTSGDRMMLDPQRVRREALRKLGLLKSDEVESSPNMSPRLSPQSRRSWAAPSSPMSPHAPPLTPAYPSVHSPSPVTITVQAPAAESPPRTLTAIPAPDAFSDPDGSLHSDNELSAGSDVSEVTPPVTPPVLIKQLSPPKILGVKSATLERSGLGLSSYMAAQDSSEAGISGKLSPNQLRNNRPRPASLGSRQEFSGAQGEGLKVGGATSKEPDIRRSMIASQPFSNSKKLPRSEGVSVLICPRSQNEEDRREALRRLGLLRD